jgi:hypothetical protein
MFVGVTSSGFRLIVVAASLDLETYPEPELVAL